MKYGKAKKISRTQKIIKLECMLLIPLLLTAGIAVMAEYDLRPGILTADALSIEDKGTDSISLSWEPVRNADKYVVSYKEKDSEDWQTVEVSGSETGVEIDGLDEGEEYDFAIRADSAEREGYTTAASTARTKKSQSIKGKQKQMKLAGSEINLGLSSETDIRINSGDEEVAKVEKENKSVVAVNPGTVTLTATAEATDEYTEDEMEIEVEVLDSVSEDSANAAIHVIDRLDKSNCEIVRKIEGDGKAVVPQSLAVSDDTYIVAYGMDDTPQKLFFFDKEDGTKTVSNPSIKLGHPNGLAYADGKCYSVRGWSATCVIYDMEADSYSSFTLPAGASGIAYDSENEQFYTSSRSALKAYTKDFEEVISIPPVRHKGQMYTQDCGGAGGIMMRCLSDKTRHGINYVDLYDMEEGKYLGSLECDLSEVEGVDVDEEGFMLLLCNTKEYEDYIWKTPINIKDLGA